MKKTRGKKDLLPRLPDKLKLLWKMGSLAQLREVRGNGFAKN